MSVDTFFVKTIRYGAHIKLSLIGILFLLLYSPIFQALYADWMHDSDNSHGILIPIVSLFLVWRSWERIPWKEARSSSIGLIILIPSLIIYLIGYAGGIFVLPRIAMVATLIGLVIYNLGEKVFKSLIFPLVFLIFMIPIPYSILKLVSLPLQTIVAKMAEHIIENLFSIPVLREGNMLHFAQTSLEVAKACSGIRSLLTFLMLGSFFAYISGGSLKRKAIFLAMAVPLAVFTNLLRVTGTGVLAHFFGRGLAKGFLHEFSGFVVLGVGIVLMMGLWKLLTITEPKTKSENQR